MCTCISCSDITWSGEYCTVCIHYSSQLFIISSGNRIDKVFSSLLMFILLHISFASQLYGIYHLFHHRQQFRWHKLYMYLSCRFSWWMTEIFVWSVQMLRKSSCFVLAIIIVLCKLRLWEDVRFVYVFVSCKITVNFYRWTVLTLSSFTSGSALFRRRCSTTSHFLSSSW